MRISNWSSDVCSSDLPADPTQLQERRSRSYNAKDDLEPLPLALVAAGLRQPRPGAGWRRRPRASDRAIRAAVRLRRRAPLRAPAPLASRAPRVRADDRRLAGATRGEPALDATRDACAGRPRRALVADPARTSDVAAQ